MKHTLLKTGIAILLCLIAQPAAFAQTLVYPTHPDIPWYTSAGSFAAGYIAGINTAMIDFILPPRPEGKLIVSDYYGNGMAGGVVFRDHYTTQTVQMPYNVPGPVVNFYIVGSPDIIVGNDITDPANVFHVAVAYICWDTSTGIIQPQIDYWTVTYVGGTFSVTFAGSTVFSSVVEPTTIHLDIIAEAGNTSPTLLPWCDSFIVTWDDNNYDVYATEASLNAPPATMTSAAAQHIATDARQPDVAAIQRTSTMGVHNKGLFTYTNAAGGKLNYIEWDATVGGLSGYALLDPGASTYNIIYPRIDAPDDYTINTPTAAPMNAYYKVVAQLNNSGGTFVSKAYDVFTVSSGIPFSNAGFMLPNDQYAPTVAFGPIDREYVIAHSAAFATALHPTWNTFMEPMDWLTGGVLTPNNYYLVNTTPFSLTNFVNGNYLTAASTPCNDPGAGSLVAWSLYDDVLGYSTVQYKISPYTYAFKPGSPAGTTTAAAPEWHIYPNPASSSLTVSVPLTGGARYEVRDMLGRAALNGTLPAGTAAVDVSSLRPGNYIINMYDGDKSGYNKLFVKQ